MTNAQQSTRTATVTTPGDRDIHIVREFDAPRDRVFALFTDPELIPQWWGPRGTTAEVVAMDARTGGDWRFICHNSDGSSTGFRGTFREITPPERVVQTFEWDGMPGYVSVDSAEFFELPDGRTKMVVTSLFHTREERDGMINAGMEGGMNETYQRLDELLAELG